MYLEQAICDYQKAFATNDNSSSFASKIPTITEPTGGSVYQVGVTGGAVPTKIILLPYGLGSNNDVFDMKLIGWRKVYSAALVALWVPTTIGVFTCTVGTAVGVAGTPVLATEAFADTIVLKSATTQPLYTDQNATPATQYRGTIEVYSPADNTIGWIRMPFGTHQKLELTFDQTTGTPTMNCLVAWE